MSSLDGLEGWLEFRRGERDRPIPRVVCTQCGGDATDSDVESPPGSPICFDCDESNGPTCTKEEYDAQQNRTDEVA